MYKSLFNCIILHCIVHRMWCTEVTPLCTYAVKRKMHLPRLLKEVPKYLPKVHIPHKQLDAD